MTENQASFKSVQHGASTTYGPRAAGRGALGAYQAGHTRLVLRPAWPRLGRRRFDWCNQRAIVAGNPANLRVQRSVILATRFAVSSPPMLPVSFESMRPMMIAMSTASAFRVWRTRVLQTTAWCRHLRRRRDRWCIELLRHGTTEGDARGVVDFDLITSRAVSFRWAAVNFAQRQLGVFRITAR